MTKAEMKNAAASWLRAVLASVAALYMSGITDPKVLLNAALAGLLAPILKALNPKDHSYGLKK